MTVGIAHNLKVYCIRCDKIPAQHATVYAWLSFVVCIVALVSTFLRDDVLWLRSVLWASFLIVASVLADTNSTTSARIRFRTFGQCVRLLGFRLAQAQLHVS